jgi:hypothetical protein
LFKQKTLNLTIIHSLKIKTGGNTLKKKYKFAELFYLINENI